MAAPLSIRHNEAAQRFEADVSGQLARCDYQRRGSVLYVYHTEVPRAFEGRGVAGQLVAALLDYARQHRLSVQPACSYVRSYMRRHPNTHDLLPSGTTQ